VFFFFQSSAGGTVPYLGTYLTVLNMMDTALPDTVEVRLESCLFRNGGLLDWLSGAHTNTHCSPRNTSATKNTQNNLAFTFQPLRSVVVTIQNTLAIT